MRTVGLFAGIGGIELGLEAAGHETVALCDADARARLVLKSYWSDVPISDDVRTLNRLPKADLVSAGFPCQDLSQAGRKAGITGQRSGLVSEVFRLVQGRGAPKSVLIENVSYMLRLDRGSAMTYLVSSLESLGFRWAYRLVDARSFGIPQRRQRVILLASRELNPEHVLFADDFPSPDFNDDVGSVRRRSLYGFYWTEGLRGLGWTRSAVPTIKGGSGLGIPSAPAIWNPTSGAFGTPTVQDAERLQGLLADWTAAAIQDKGRTGDRWRLIGNAVCVPMSTWVGQRLLAPSEPVVERQPLDPSRGWPAAAAGDRKRRWRLDASVAPTAPTYNLRHFLRDKPQPLSHRAASGFLSRARRSQLNFPDGFLDSLSNYVS